MEPKGRIEEWWKALTARVEKWSLLAWFLFVAFVATISGVLSNEYFNSFHQAFLWVAARVESAATRPIGVVILLLVVSYALLIALLILMAFIETSSAGRAVVERLGRQPKLRAPSLQEHAEIEAAAEKWGDQQDVAWQKLSQLLFAAIQHFGDQGNTFAALLQPQIDRLNEAGKRVRMAIDPQNSSRTLVEIQQSLKNFHREYTLSVCWLNRCTFDDPSFLANRHDSYVRLAWQDAHLSLDSVFAMLSKRAAYLNCIPSALSSDPNAIVFQGELIHRDSVAKSRARAAAERLALLTDEEESFLNLFTMAENPMRSGEPSTFLANSTYRAGETLSANGVLSSSAIREGVVRFVLPDASVSAWAGSARPELPVRRSIDIDLSMVLGTGASGSGAAGRSVRSQFDPPYIAPSRP